MDILEKIIYDSRDSQMVEAMRASLEEGSSITTQDAALSYIGSRGHGGTQIREKRMQNAKLIL